MLEFSFVPSFFRVIGKQTRERVLRGKILKYSCTSTSSSRPAPSSLNYGAFSTSTSKFLGQIQSTNIDTSYKSILPRLSNNEKIIWGKKPHLLPCGSISFTPTRRSVASWARAILDIFELEIVHSLNFLITIDLRRGYTREGCFDVA